MECTSQSHHVLSLEARSALARRLSCELEQIYRAHKLDKLLKPARLHLSDNMQYLGLWNPNTREITLSYRLAVSYCWSEILEFLKHEIAHQLVDEHYREEQSDVHGPIFLKACERICVAHWARHPRIHTHPQSPSLRELIGDQSSPIELKITKLLRLSESSNTHEAALALAKVRELQDKYSLHRQNPQGREGNVQRNHQQSIFSDIHFIRIPTKQKRRSAYMASLANILGLHFQVQCIFTHAYSPQNSCDFVEIEIIGYPKDLLMAEHVYYYLIRMCEYLWQKHQKSDVFDRSKVSVRVAKSSFIDGLLEGFNAKLTAQKQSASKASREDDILIHSSTTTLPANTTRALAEHRKTLNTYMKRRHPYTQNQSIGRGRRHNPSLYQKGQKASSELQIRDPLAASSSSHQQLQLNSRRS